MPMFHVSHVALLQVYELVSVVIPLRDITFPEKIDNRNMQADNAILLSTKSKSSFLFSQIEDRDFIITKIAELLSRLSDEHRYGTRCSDTTRQSLIPAVA